MRPVFRWGGRRTAGARTCDEFPPVNGAVLVLRMNQQTFDRAKNDLQNSFKHACECGVSFPVLQG